MSVVVFDSATASGADEMIVLFACTQLPDDADGPCQLYKVQPGPQA